MTNRHNDTQWLVISTARHGWVVLNVKMKAVQSFSRTAWSIHPQRLWFLIPMRRKVKNGKQENFVGERKAAQNLELYLSYHHMLPLCNAAERLVIENLSGMQ